MKTTVNLPDALVREIKLRAVQEGRKLRDLIADLLRQGLSPTNNPAIPDKQNVPKTLPLMKVQMARPCQTEEIQPQTWCEWIKDAEAQLDVDHHEAVVGYQHLDRADS